CSTAPSQLTASAVQRYHHNPPASHFGKLEAMSPGMGEVAAFENARAIALDLAELGLTVDCLPVLDLPQSDADPIIGDRAYGTTPDAVIPLARRSVEGLIAGGVLPVIKHLPGHGRALQDSHLALPRVGASLPELEAHDFRPFQAFSDMPLGMTAHIVYDAIDPDRPLTLSPAGIASTIRGPAPSGLQFDGLLMTDDLSMKALDGPFERRASEALAAGCDVVLHCNGEPDEMLAVAKGVTVLSGTAAKRARRVDRWIETLAGPLASDPRGVADQLLAALDAPRGAG
ncbi:MAG: glycoside hydrolase family 3 N-terminal domain-containing protein, partial [Pseudomonadota bacterium]